MKYRWVQEGYPLFWISGLLLLIGLLLNGGLRALPWRVAGIVIALLGLALGVISLVFFRDPERLSGAAENKIVAPADGRVVAVEEVTEDQYFKGPARRVAIFMHIGNVHVQRVPTPGKLVWMRHKPGLYRPAFMAEAAKVNEQRWYAFESSGRKYALVQIAGLVARRTISWIQPDRIYHRGERLGMIAFGSEVDTYWPLEVTITVKPGDKVLAGQTIIGEWSK